MVPVGGRVNVLEFEYLLLLWRGAVVAGDKTITHGLEFFRNGEVWRLGNVFEENAFGSGELMHHAQAHSRQ